VLRAHGLGSLGRSTGSVLFLPPKKSCLLLAAEALLFQSGLPQISLSQLNGSLIASFQPVPQETPALPPAWHFAHAVIPKAAAGVKPGLVTPGDEGVLHPSLPSQSRGADAWRGLRSLAACRRCRWIPQPLCVLVSFLTRMISEIKFTHVVFCDDYWMTGEEKEGKRDL